MKPPRILVHTLFTLFKRHSYPVHILLTKHTYLYINHGIRRREGMKEKNCFAGRFSDVIPLQQDVSAPHFLSATDCFPSPCGQSALQCRHRDTLACEKTAPQCCKHRQLVLPTKLKPICTKSKFFTSLLLHSTSLLACPTSLLDVYPTVIQTIKKIKN